MATAVDIGEHSVSVQSASFLVTQMAQSMHVIHEKKMIVNLLFHYIHSLLWGEFILVMTEDYVNYGNILNILCIKHCCHLTMVLSAFQTVQ
jgi:hypothetical protein